MEYRTLGRTELRVSRLGIGSGGPSRFGQLSGVPETEIHRMVRVALDKGVNFFDTAAAYGESESILGRALKGVSRNSYIVATKFNAFDGKNPIPPEVIVQSVERSLQRLDLETVDILQFHGLQPDQFVRSRDTLMPTLEKLRKEGKFRFLGVTETFRRDWKHEMLSMALRDNWVDTVMVGYNLLNPTAEREVLPLCENKNVGVICMVPVRCSLSRPEYLKKLLLEAKDRGLIAGDVLPEEKPLDWLIKDSVTSLPAAGYKYVAAHPAVHTTLSGTSKIDHLEENIAAINGHSLPDEDMARLRSIFGNVWESLIN